MKHPFLILLFLMGQLEAYDAPLFRHRSESFLAKLSAIGSPIQLAIAPIAAAVLIKEGAHYLFNPLANDAYQGISRSCVDQQLRSLDPGVADFFSLCVNSQGETRQAIEARKQLVQFDALRISEPYRGEILDLQANVANSFFDKQSELTLERNELLGLTLDSFLRSHLDHDTYLAAQNLLDDASSRSIIDYHQTSRMGKTVHGLRVGLIKMQQLFHQHTSQRPLAELQAHPQLQALSSCIKAVAHGDMKEARAYAQQAGAVGKKYFQQAHDAWKREHCNEYGVKKAYEVDRDWQRLSTEEKEFVKTNELQREKLCAHLERRDQVRQQLYDQYGLRRDHVPTDVRSAIEDFVESQCVLVTNIASGVDTFINKADQSSAVDEVFFNRSGILKDFARDPVINHFDLNQSDLKLHPELRRATNYCLAIRSSNAPPEAKQLATNVLNTISDQLQGKQLVTDTAQAMHELLHNYPAILQQEAYPKPPDEFQLKQLATNCAATPATKAVINEVTKEGALVAKQTYEVNRDSRVLLTRNNISIPQYCVLTGDQLQRQAHGQIVDHLNTIGALDAKPLYKKTIPIHNDVAKLTQVGVEQVRHGNIAEAWGIAHICKQAIVYVKAVGDGVQEGLGNAATHIKDHPAAFALTAAAQVVASKAFLTFQAASIVADLSGMAYGQLKQVDYKNLTVSKVVHGLKHVSQECRKQAAWLLTPDGIKKATATATNLYAQYQATKLVGNIYCYVFKNAQTALSNARECLQAENVVQLADGTKLAVPPGDMQMLHMDSQTPPAQSKPRAGVARGLHDNAVLSSIDLPKTGKGTIQQFDIIEKMRKHIFSEKHVTDGINKLGSSEGDIIKKIANIIVQVDQKGLLKLKSTQIRTTVNGIPVTIRCFVENNKVLMMDAFVGHAKRLTIDTIDWPL